MAERGGGLMKRSLARNPKEEDTVVKNVNLCHVGGYSVTKRFRRRVCFIYLFFSS